MIEPSRISAQVKNLLANPDANVNRSVLGVTPLMVAAANGHAPVVRLLLLAGADKSAEDADGLKAYEWAEGQPQIREMLMVGAPKPRPPVESRPAAALPASAPATERGQKVDKILKATDGDRMAEAFAANFMTRRASVERVGALEP